MYNVWIIQELGWNPSDHTPISIECELSFENRTLGRLASADILTDQSKKTFKTFKKIDTKRVNTPI